MIYQQGGDFMIKPRVTEIRTTRIKNGLSSRALAAKAGIHFSTATLLEKDGHNVSPATAKAVCDALFVPFDELFIISRLEEGRANGTGECSNK
jgi:transcriptional regulator with XRE-family HTH domain